MTAPVNPVEAVRERLGENGERWHKGSIGDGAGNVCVVGAARDVLREDVETGTSVERLIGRVAVEQYRDRISTQSLMNVGATGIPDFNDHPDTVWADVDLVLDKAARRWDEQS